MNKKYFPGANSGEGFFSRFDGIIPKNAPHHYTYVLKGGPGVGKNTLMKKAMKKALEKGYTVEEFRCASDPKSLDAIRIVELSTVILDGTSPHSIDPLLPGVDEEIINLGSFKKHKEFQSRKEELKALFASNKSYYASAYSMLRAASELKREAQRAASEVLNFDKMHSLLMRVLPQKKQGSGRQLFARTAAPDGIVDFSSSFLPEKTVFFSGTLGEVAMAQAKKILFCKDADIMYDFLCPNAPYSIVFGECAVSLSDAGDSLYELLRSPLPTHTTFCAEKADKLVSRATRELAKALEVHDKIEAVYREYVDYDAVNEMAENLLLRIGL